MICYLCGRRLKRASTVPPMGPVCARKAGRREEASLFSGFDLDRMCADAMARVDAFIANRFVCN
jgi:hypothetical protein